MNERKRLKFTHTLILVPSSKQEPVTPVRGSLNDGVTHCLGLEETESSALAQAGHKQLTDLDTRTYLDPNSMTSSIS